MKTKKIELIELLSQELRERRERFLKLFVKWIHSINTRYKIKKRKSINYLT